MPCGPATVMRVASISKPLTSAAAARLCEEGKLELDVPVQKYVPEFPRKRFNGQDVSHSSSTEPEVFFLTGNVLAHARVIRCRSR